MKKVFVLSAMMLTAVVGLAKDITGRHVIIVEDIIDSGLTMAHMIETLAAHNPASIAVCSCLVKPDALKVQIPIDYRCLDIPNDFIVGYGLDLDQDYRHLPYISWVKED